MHQDTAAAAPTLTPAQGDPSIDEHVGGETADARELVMAFYGAFDAGTLGRYDRIGPGFEARVFGATVLDWPGFLAFGESFRAGFPDGRHVFDHVVTEHDAVATIGRYRGTHTQPFMGVPPTGREVDFTVMHLDRVRDGRLIEHRGIGDAGTLWAQLGVSPPAG